MTKIGQKQGSDGFIVIVVLSSVIYNAVLALINAHVMALSFSHVALTEIGILAAVLVYILRRGIYVQDMAIFLYLIATFVMMLYVSVLNRAPVVDYFRNILIIFCFAAAGTWANAQTVKSAFKIACSLVLLVLMIEIFAIGLYETLFYPMSYFENTRGIEQVSFDGSKLFQNSLRIEGRFSFGIINHRASSLFLEQVSLANFSGVLLVFIVSFWQSLKLGERVLFVSTILLILVTNDSRSMLIFAGICFVGYFVFPHLPRLVAMLYMPLIVLAGLIVYMLKPDASGDTLDGRVVLTMKHLFETDISAMLGLYAARAAEFADSGYLYVIYGGTIFGLVVFWIFVCFFPASQTSSQRRCLHSLSVFIFMNMMIGGTAVFSIKVAGLLWLLVGHLKFAPTGRSIPGALAASVAPTTGKA